MKVSLPVYIVRTVKVGEGRWGRDKTSSLLAICRWKWIPSLSTDALTNLPSHSFRPQILHIYYLKYAVWTIRHTGDVPSQQFSSSMSTFTSALQMHSNNLDATVSTR